MEEGRFYWVDRTGQRVGKPTIWRLDPRSGKVENWALDHDVGAVALRKDGNAVLAKVDDGIECSNGPCWSPDDKTFYFADTFQEEFWAYDYDIETGNVSNKRVFATTKDDLGVADGSTVDAEGYMWNAQVTGGELVRYAPDGSVERRIGMPVKNVTSVIFGGENMDEIYVTSMARVAHPGADALGHFAVESKPQFGAGGLFRITGLGIQGVPGTRFGG